MPDYPQLTYISVEMLISAAGGDPWTVDETVRSGDPGEIADLARVFHEAGACTAETYREFVQAQTRFRASWNHEDGGYPINDSAEVHRASTNLLVQSEELPAIGADLQVIAADLAEAQRFSDLHIDNLNTQLHYLDACIGQAIAADEEFSELEESAVSVARSALGSVEAIRDDYAAKLERSLTELRHDHGYDPAVIEDVDGDTEAGPLQRARTAADYYELNQRAKDEALATSPGPMSSEKLAAAARLRDFGALTNLALDPESRRLAGERLDDFRMAGFSGPLPRDPILGGDARTRAQARLHWQGELERGLLGYPMSADQATSVLDENERTGRVLTVQHAVDGLMARGMSADGAQDLVSEVSKGTPWRELIEYHSELMGTGGDGVKAMADAASNGRHYRPDVLTASDAEVLLKAGRHLGTAGTVVDGLLTLNELRNGAPPGETIGEFVGSTAVGGAAAWMTTVAAGTLLGPGGTFVAVIAATAIAADKGGDLGKWIGASFDK